MAKKSSKGSAFEREVCKKLSLWWTNGKDDAVFWRSQSSGARFTTRKKKGKQTYGQDGDIQAVNPIGEGLTKNISIECKRGYSKFPFSDIFENNSKHPLFDFINQAKKGATDSGKEYWILIFKRDRRLPIVFLPYTLYKKILTDCRGNRGFFFHEKLGKVNFLSFTSFLKHTNKNNL